MRKILSGRGNSNYKAVRQERACLLCQGFTEEDPDKRRAQGGRQPMNSQASVDLERVWIVF